MGSTHSSPTGSIGLYTPIIGLPAHHSFLKAVWFMRDLKENTWTHPDGDIIHIYITPSIKGKLSSQPCHAVDYMIKESRWVSDDMTEEDKECIEQNQFFVPPLRFRLDPLLIDPKLSKSSKTLNKKDKIDKKGTANHQSPTLLSPTLTPSPLIVTPSSPSTIYNNLGNNNDEAVVNDLMVYSIGNDNYPKPSFDPSYTPSPDEYCPIFRYPQAHGRHTLIKNQTDKLKGDFQYVMDFSVISPKTNRPMRFPHQFLELLFHPLISNTSRIPMYVVVIDMCDDVSIKHFLLFFSAIQHAYNTNNVYFDHTVPIIILMLNQHLLDQTLITRAQIENLFYSIPFNPHYYTYGAGGSVDELYGNVTTPNSIQPSTTPVSVGSLASPTGTTGTTATTVPLTVSPSPIQNNPSEPDEVSTDTNLVFKMKEKRLLAQFLDATLLNSVLNLYHTLPQSLLAPHIITKQQRYSRRFIATGGERLYPFKTQINVPLMPQCLTPFFIPCHLDQQMRERFSRNELKRRVLPYLKKWYEEECRIIKRNRQSTHGQNPPYNIATHHSNRVLTIHRAFVDALDHVVPPLYDETHHCVPLSAFYQSFINLPQDLKVTSFHFLGTTTKCDAQMINNPDTSTSLSNNNQAKSTKSYNYGAVVTALPSNQKVPILVPTPINPPITPILVNNCDVPDALRSLVVIDEGLASPTLLTSPITTYNHIDDTEHLFHVQSIQPIVHEKNTIDTSDILDPNNNNLHTQDHINSDTDDDSDNDQSLNLTPAQINIKHTYKAQLKQVLSTKHEADKLVTDYPNRPITSFVNQINHTITKSTNSTSLLNEVSPPSSLVSKDNTVGELTPKGLVQQPSQHYDDHHHHCYDLPPLSHDTVPYHFQIDLSLPSDARSHQITMDTYQSVANIIILDQNAIVTATTTSQSSTQQQPQSPSQNQPNNINNSTPQPPTSPAPILAPTPMVQNISASVKSLHNHSNNNGNDGNDTMMNTNFNPSISPHFSLFATMNDHIGFNYAPYFVLIVTDYEEVNEEQNDNDNNTSFLLPILDQDTSITSTSIILSDNTDPDVDINNIHNPNINKRPVSSSTTIYPSDEHCQQIISKLFPFIPATSHTIARYDKLLNNAAGTGRNSENTHNTVITTKLAASGDIYYHLFTTMSELNSTINKALKIAVVQRMHSYLQSKL